MDTQANLLCCAGWPSVKIMPDGAFLMIYHCAKLSEGNMTWALGTAVSANGVEWQKQGPCTIIGTDGAPSDDAFSCRGFGTRDFVISHDSGRVLDPDMPGMAQC
jgi:hypothetical protein